MKRIAIVTLFLAGTLLQGAPVFTLTPSADLTSGPGATTGWGFDITPDNLFAISIISTFVVDPSDAAFGTYTDLVSLLGGPDSGFLLPGPHWIQPPPSGIGSFQLAPDAQGIFTALLHIDYEVYAVNGGSPGDFVSTESVELPISVTATPEPASWILLLPILAGAMFARLVPIRLCLARSGD
jgi:hypothetical protein